MAPPQLSAPTLAVLLVVALVVGGLIGTVGVGGVLLAPALVSVAGLDVHAATATSTWAFVFAAVVGTQRYSRHGQVPWRLFLRLSIGVVPAVLLGVWANRALPAEVVLALLAVVALVSGVANLGPAVPDRPARRLGPVATTATGAGVGFGSALTGTSGPVLLVPALLALRLRPMTAVAASQVVQLPVVVVASAGFLAAGAVHLWLGTVLGVVAGAGTAVGAAVARRLPAHGLRMVVALACCGAGLLLAARVTLLILA